MPSLTEVLDNLYTTTWQNMKSQTADQIYDATPFWFWMKEHGRIDSEEGGRFLTEPLRFAKSDNVKFIQKGGTVSLADKEFLTIAKYDWRYLVDSIVRFGVDDQQNRGKNQIISLMKAKLENSKDSLVDKIETVLFDTFVNHGSIGFHGLQDIVPDNPTVTAATLGGVDPSVDTWWRSQFKDMTGISMATNLRKEMTTMMHKCMNNIRQDRPDIIVSGQTPYEAYEDLTIVQKRISNQKLGDAGFENIEFKGAPMIWSPSCSNLRMYFLNTKKHLRFKRDPMMNFDMTEWKAIPDQVNDRAAQIILAGNLVTGRRRVHGVIFDLDTP